MTRQGAVGSRVQTMTKVHDDTATTESHGDCIFNGKGPTAMRG